MRVSLALRNCHSRWSAVLPCALAPHGRTPCQHRVRQPLGSRLYARRQQRHTARHFTSAVRRRSYVNAADIEPYSHLVTKPEQEHIAETGERIREVIEVEPVASRPVARLTLRRSTTTSPRTLPPTPKPSCATSWPALQRSPTLRASVGACPSSMTRISVRFPPTPGASSTSCGTTPCSSSPSSTAAAHRHPRSCVAEPPLWPIGTQRLAAGYPASLEEHVTSKTNERSLRERTVTCTATSPPLTADVVHHLCAAQSHQPQWP